MNLNIKNLKIIIGTIYLSLFIIILYFLFHFIDLKDLTNYNFIKLNKDILFNYKNENFLILAIIFFFFSIIWILFLGIVTPLLILSGFIFGKWWGTIIVVVGASIGATILYIISNLFLKNIIKKYLEKKFYKIKIFFSKNDIIYFMLLRFMGGIPFTIQNLFPILFNMPVKRYFIATILGSIPQMFISVALGSGLESLLKHNDEIDFKDVISYPQLFIPIIFMIVLLFISSLMRKFFFKK